MTELELFVQANHSNRANISKHLESTVPVSNLLFAGSVESIPPTMSVSSSNSSGPLVLTFRSHHNAYEEGDGSGATVIRHEQPTGLLYSIVQHIFGMVVIHYFLWFIPMLFILWLPYHLGYPIISLILLGMYLPTYFRADELKRGRPWEGFRQNPLFKMLLHYGQVEIVREAELDPKRKYIFGFHPHGILILSRISTYGGFFEKLFPGIEQRCLGATPMFNHPGSREVCLWMGAVRADKSNAVRMLEKEKLNLLLYPGGSEEIFLTEPKSLETTLIARKGFIRLALQHGCDLVPSFVFGEKHAYKKMEIPKAIKAFFMKQFRLPLIIFWGRFFTWLPVKHDNVFLSIVYGTPIRTQRVIPDPTDEEVDAVYDQFYGEITNLYNKYKGKYGYDEKEVLIIKEARSKQASLNAKHAATKENGLNNNGVIKKNGVHKEHGIANENGNYTGNGVEAH